MRHAVKAALVAATIIAPARVAVSATITVHEPDGEGPPVVEPRCSTENEKAVDLPSSPKYLKKAKPLDGLQRERFNWLCESVKDLPPKEQASRVHEYFGIVGGARPADLMGLCLLRYKGG
jgi:hypothetical protein